MQSLLVPQGLVPVSASLIKCSAVLDTPDTVERAMATNGLGSVTVIKVPTGGSVRGISRLSETKLIVATPATFVRVTMSLGSPEASRNTAVWALAKVNPGQETLRVVSGTGGISVSSAMLVVTPAEHATGWARVPTAASKQRTNVNKMLEAVFIHFSFQFLMKARVKLRAGSHKTTGMLATQSGFDLNSPR
jgi:hypothetical protein